MKRALVFGAGGQDGSYLTELLLGRGYEVHGTSRRSSVDNLVRLGRHRDRVVLHRCDLTDPVSVRRAVELAYCGDGPLEIYNMADQDHVGWSEDTPSYSVQVTAGGVATLLATVEMVEELRGSIRVFQPLSATVFGPNPAPNQTPDTPPNPQSPYACAKAHAWHLCRMYRARGLFVSCGIMYNHDSPRRGGDYLLQKLARGERLSGDLDILVDVGYAPEYVEAAWRMMGKSVFPMDICIGTGRTFMIGDLADYARGGRRPSPVSGTPGQRRLSPDPAPAVQQIGWRAGYDATNVLDVLIGRGQRRDGGADQNQEEAPAGGRQAD